MLLFLILLQVILGVFLLCFVLFCFGFLVSVFKKKKNNRKFLLQFVPKFQAPLASESHHVRTLAWGLSKDPYLSPLGNEGPGTGVKGTGSSG